MDPLVEMIHRWDTRHPYDHSLDGLPLTVGVIALVTIFAVSLALGRTGRSWKRWQSPALAVFFTWWAGVHVGLYGIWSVAGVLMTLTSALLLFEPMRTTLRAALSPSKSG